MFCSHNQIQTNLLLFLFPVNVAPCSNRSSDGKEIGTHTVLAFQYRLNKHFRASSAMVCDSELQTVLLSSSARDHRMNMWILWRKALYYVHNVRTLISLRLIWDCADMSFGRKFVCFLKQITFLGCAFEIPSSPGLIPNLVSNRLFEMKFWVFPFFLSVSDMSLSISRILAEIVLFFLFSSVLRFNFIARVWVSVFDSCETI